MKRLMNTCLIAAGCMAGCSSSDPATEADYDDVAQALTAGVVTDNEGGEVGAMVDAAQIAHGEGSLNLSVDASGTFTGSHLGLDYKYTASCSNAEGTKLDKCDKTTDSAKVAVKWSGDLALPNLTAAVKREGAWTLEGLQSDEVTFDGDGSFELDAELASLFRNITRSYQLNYEAEYADVVLDRTAHKIKSGRVTYSIDAERTAKGPRRESEAQFTMDGVLEFTGDGSATLTLDRNYKYQIDLTTAALTKK